MCSSSAGVIANRGQANYAATNTFMDAFVCQLMTGGYPATSISLGSVFSVDSIALAYRALWEDLLFSFLECHITPAWGAAQSTQTGHTVVGIRSARDSQRQSILLPGFMAHSLSFPRRAIAGRSQMVEQEVEAAVDVVTRAIVDELARIMALSIQEIDPQRSLGSYEVDSLVTVDLKMWFQREVGVGSGELLAELAMTQLVRQAADGSQFSPAELRRS
ncbi:ochratoxin highly reducing polyketide synthase ota1 [Aspergillus tubingensis]|nr:ochratoxin highly reducing polyketide synthase ota1 [Aspergillus tubingensis]